MESEPRVWELLRGLAASKPGGRFLETGAGTGLATFWLLQGMNSSATLVSVEREQRFLQVAQSHLGTDPRVQFCLGDSMSAVETIPPGSVDLCFADGEPGKYQDLDKILDLLSPGGIYVVDDLFFRPHWPASFQDFRLGCCKAFTRAVTGLSLCWSTGREWPYLSAPFETRRRKLARLPEAGNRSVMPAFTQTGNWKLVATSAALHMIGYSPYVVLPTLASLGGIPKLELLLSLIGLSAAGGLSSIKVGDALDRFGGARVATFGLSMLTLGYGALALASRVPELWLIIGCVLGIGIQATGGQTAFYIVQKQKGASSAQSHFVANIGISAAGLILPWVVMAAGMNGGWEIDQLDVLRAVRHRFPDWPGCCVEEPN